MGSVTRPGTRVVQLPALVLAAMAGAGCGVNTHPEAPSWDTQFNVPLVSQVHTMQDLIGQDGVVITTSEEAILGFRVEGDTITTEVSDHLSIAGFTGSFHDSLGEFDVRDPGARGTGFDLGTLWPPSVALSGTTAPIPAFNFTSLSSDLADFTTFSAVTLSGGTLSVTITNQLPVAVNLSAVDVVERGSGHVVTTIGFPSTIASSASVTRTADLGGTAFSNRLAVHVAGGSPGTGGAVLIDRTASVDVDTDLTGLTASAATSQVPATDFSFSDQIALPSDMTVTTASVASGSLDIDVASALPVGSQLDLTIPGLITSGGAPLTLVIPVTAGGSAHRTVDLAGYQLAPGVPDGTGTQHLAIDVAAQTQDSGTSTVAVSASDDVNLDAGVSSLTLASVSGVLSATTVDVAADTTTVDLPDGLESIGLVQASLDVVITTAIQYPLTLDLVAHGHGRSGDQDLPIQGSFPEGPGSGMRTLHLRLDETNSDIVPFLNSLPEEIAFGGTVTLGDGIASSSVNQHDTFTASFAMSTPLRMTMQPQTIAPEPSNLVTIEGNDGAGTSGSETTLSPDVTRRLLDGSVLIQVANHLPFGMDLRVKLATDSTRVSSAPDVVVGPFSVQPGQIDPVTGLVSTATVSTSTLTLSSTDLDIFKNQGTAPKPIWGGVELVVSGTGGHTVSVRAGDYVDISALAHLGVRIDPAD